MNFTAAERDPRIDPQKGDMLHLSNFGSGMLFTVTDVKEPDAHCMNWRSKQGIVNCHLSPDDGHWLRKATRSYGMDGWSEFMRTATLVKP